METQRNLNSEFKTFWSGVRPPRVALLISEDSQMDQWQEAIDICSQTWGGSHFVVVPTDGTRITELFWGLLKQYDPDYIVRLRPLKIDEDLAHKIRDIINPFPELREFGEPDRINLVSLDNISHPMTHVSDVVDSGWGGSMPIVKAEPWVELLAYSHIGRFTPKTVERLQDRDLSISYPDYDLLKNIPDCRNDLWKLAWGYSQFLPRDLAMAHVLEYRDNSGLWLNMPIILVVGESASDFCLFYSLSHMRPDVYWAPTAILNAISDENHTEKASLLENTAFHLAQHIHGRVNETIDPHPFWVTSVGKEEFELKHDIENLERARFIKGPGDSLPELAKYEFGIDSLLKVRHFV